MHHRQWGSRGCWPSRGRCGGCMNSWYGIESFVLGVVWIVNCELRLKNEPWPWLFWQICRRQMFQVENPSWAGMYFISWSLCNKRLLSSICYDCDDDHDKNRYMDGIIPHLSLLSLDIRKIKKQTKPWPLLRRKRRKQFSAETFFTSFLLKNYISPSSSSSSFYFWPSPLSLFPWTKQTQQ